MDRDQPLPPEDPLSHPLVARSDRRMFVNGLTLLALGAVAYGSWPTEGRKLEKRVAIYLDARSRGDAAGALAFLSPAARQRLPAQGKARIELLSAQVDEGGQTATVTWTDEGSRAPAVTAWVRIDRVWYLDGPVR